VLKFRSAAVKDEFQFLAIAAVRQHSNTASLNLFGGVMKDILDQMEEHIAAIRNLQRNFDFHSKILEKLMISLTNCHLETQQGNDVDKILYSDKKE